LGNHALAWKGVSEAVARNERQHLERKILVFASKLSPKCESPYSILGLMGKA
jgi:hypothetical protein